VVHEANGGEASTQLRIRDLLAARSLGLRLITAPDQADRPVRWAHPSELIELRPYLKGGELVLTVGSSLTTSAACLTLVDHLVACDAAALGFGVGDTHESVPEALVEACAAAGLPLLEVPYGVPFQAITELLVDRRLEVRSARTRLLQVLTGRLLDAVADDTAVPDLLALIANDLGGEVAFEGGELSWRPTHESDVAPTTETLRQLGRVVAVRQHEEDSDVAHRRLEMGHLLELVSAGRADAEVLSLPLRDLGLADDGALVPAVWPARAADLVGPLLGRSLIAETDEMTITISLDADRVRATADDLSLPCGLGEPTLLATLPRALMPAVAAFRLSKKRGGLVSHRELTTFEGLLELQPPDRLAAFTDSLLAPLVAQDRSHNSELVRTLREFIAREGSTNATAEAMFLHPNSLRHRLRRIEELTGANPRTFHDRIAFAIALWASDHRPRGRR
jgi:hypothetical protein